MLARHTPTRMRGSGVVQGLKSLASKLHPQLPLSPKESQRLLTALTSSFRQKLDEAHPRQAHDEDAAPTVAIGNSLKTGNHAIHASSVAFADRHLASVLTSPLLTKSNGTKKPTLNLESAKLELEQNPHRDPISLLEEYHQKAGATLTIAAFCLVQFRESLLHLSPNDRKAKVKECRAGARTFIWLLESKLYDTNEFVDDRRLMTVLVTMLVEEGREKDLWSWLEMDLTLGQPDRLVRPSPGQPLSKTVLGSRAHRHRWKDFVIRSLIRLKLDPDNCASLNSALDTFFRALDLQRQMVRDSRTNYLPLTSAVHTLNRWIFSYRTERKRWDVARYDRYMESVDGVDPIPCWREFAKARLRLTHPRHPSPLPIFESLKTSYMADSRSQNLGIWRSFTKDISRERDRQKARTFKYHVLAETARQLRDLGHTEDVEWLVAQIRNIYPEYAHDIEDHSTTGSPPPPPPKRRSQGEFSTMHPTLVSFTKFGPV